MQMGEVGVNPQAYRQPHQLCDTSTMGGLCLVIHSRKDKHMLFWHYNHPDTSFPPFSSNTLKGKGQVLLPHGFKALQKLSSTH